MTCGRCVYGPWVKTRLKDWVRVCKRCGVLERTTTEPERHQ
jgi:hypothetical protein